MPSDVHDRMQTLRKWRNAADKHDDARWAREGPRSREAAEQFLVVLAMEAREPAAAAKAAGGRRDEPRPKGRPRRAEPHPKDRPCSNEPETKGRPRRAATSPNQVAARAACSAAEA